MDTEFARHQMICRQVRAWDVTELNVLNVISVVARENFVPHGYGDLPLAYTAIPLGHEQKMMTPIGEGRMFAVIGEPPVGAAQMIVRGRESDWTSTALFETDLAPLVNFPIGNRFRS